MKYVEVDHENDAGALTASFLDEDTFDLITDDKVVNTFSVFDGSVIAFSISTADKESIEIYNITNEFELIHTVEIDSDYEKNPGHNLLNLGPISARKNPKDYKLIYEVTDVNDEDIVIVNEVHFYESGDIFEFPNLFSFYISAPNKNIFQHYLTFQNTQLVFATDEGKNFRTFVNCGPDQIIHEESSSLRRRLEHVDPELVDFIAIDNFEP